MTDEYIYLNSDSVEAEDRAIIVLPEIFGVNGFIRSTVDTLAEEQKCLVLALDHLYSGSGKAEVFDYEEGREKAFAAMNLVTGEGFLDLFIKTLNKIQKNYHNIKTFTVVGFCFGGRLAFLAGTDSRVDRVVSFYGGGPHTPFYNGLGSLESLIKFRSNRDLSILAFYGDSDTMIPATDRDKTEKILNKAGIKFSGITYECGHAFANFERTSYDKKAAESAWKAVSKFLS